MRGGCPLPQLVGGFPSTKDMKQSMITRMRDPYLQSRRPFVEFVPSRHREQGPYRNLAPPAPHTLEST